MSEMKFDLNNVTTFIGTDPKMEKLEKLLTSYAKEIHGEGFDLNVEELFDGTLSDMGYEELDYTMDAFSESIVRDIATRIFSNFNTA